MWRSAGSATRSAILIALVGAATGCHYSFGVEASNPEIEYECRYFDCDDEDYQFTTTLYSTEPQETHPRHLAYVEIDHLRRPYYQRDEPLRSVFRAEVYEGSGELDVASVMVTHSRDGVQLQPIQVHQDTTYRCTSCDVRSLVTELSFVYEGVGRGDLIERIKFAFLVDGERREFEYVFPLEYRFHYSLWDALMGI